MSTTALQSFHCPCGAAQFTVQKRPLMRFICHCLICQSVYKAPFADITAFTGSGVSVTTLDKIQFKRLRPPPAVRRGLCTSCGAPVLGFLRVAPFFTVAFVPTRNLGGFPDIPEPMLHIFYHRRVADVPDTLPKFEGYWASELAVTKELFKNLVRGDA